METTDFAHHFSNDNIPFGIASSPSHSNLQAVTRLGNSVIFLQDLWEAGYFRDIPEIHGRTFAQDTLNDFATCSGAARLAVRATLQQVDTGNGKLNLPGGSWEEVESCQMHLPMLTRDFADFSGSSNHFQNAGRIMGKTAGLPSSFFMFPPGYHGRTSSLVVSGEEIPRPIGFCGIQDDEGKSSIRHGPSAKIDYEVELGVVVGPPIPRGSCLHASQAEEHIFGFVILNDWTARDIQGLEMTPLGPFNGKSLATTISPWIVTIEALQPFKIASPISQSTTAPCLIDPARTTFNITLQAEILQSSSSTRTGTCNLSSLYWTPQQMMAHYVSSGSPLRTGDLIATGTISGSSSHTSYGCLLETTEGGTRPIQLIDGSQRAFLNDNDVVRIVAFAGDASSGVGFGACVGKVVGPRRRDLVSDRAI